MDKKENINFIFQFNNKSRSSNVFALYIASGILFLGAAFYFLATNMNVPLIAVVVVGIVYFIIFNGIKPTFFEMLVTETSFQVNYYSVASTMRSYHSVEIGYDQFAGFEVKKKKRGLKPELVLSVESKFGVADYPPVSISLVSKKEQEQVSEVLDQILIRKYQFAHR